MSREVVLLLGVCVETNKQNEKPKTSKKKKEKTIRNLSQVSFQLKLVSDTRIVTRFRRTLYYFFGFSTNDGTVSNVKRTPVFSLINGRYSQASSVENESSGPLSQVTTDGGRYSIPTIVGVLRTRT